MRYSDNYYKCLHRNESLNRCRSSNYRKRQTSLSEYKISDFKREGKYFDQRFHQRVHQTNRPEYLEVTDSWKRGLDAPLILRSQIEGEKPRKYYYQTLALLGYWANFVNNAFNKGLLTGTYEKTDSGDLELTGIEWNCTDNDIQSLILSVFQGGVNPNNSEMDFRANCTCPDFTGRTLMPDDDDYDKAHLDYEIENGEIPKHGVVIGTRGRDPETGKRKRGADFLAKRNALIVEANRFPKSADYNPDPGCKHLYKICLKSSDLTRNSDFLDDMLEIVVQPEFLEKAYIYLSNQLLH